MAKQNVSQENDNSPEGNEREEIVQMFIEYPINNIYF